MVDRIIADTRPIQSLFFTSSRNQVKARKKRRDWTHSRNIKTQFLGLWDDLLPQASWSSSPCGVNSTLLPNATKTVTGTFSRLTLNWTRSERRSEHLGPGFLDYSPALGQDSSTIDLRGDIDRLGCGDDGRT